MTVTRREAMKHGGKAVVAAAVLPVIPATAFGANNDAALVRMEKECFRLIGGINAGLHSPDGDISEEVWDRRCDLVDAIADTPAHGLEGVAVKLRMAVYEIGEIAGADWTTEHGCVQTALETVERLAARVS